LRIAITTPDHIEMLIVIAAPGYLRLYI
jgi:hypothetical protein